MKYFVSITVSLLISTSAAFAGKVQVYHDGKMETYEWKDGKLSEATTVDAAKVIVHFSNDINNAGDIKTIMDEIKKRKNAKDEDVVSLISFIGAAKGGIEGMKESKHPLATGAVGAVKGAFGL
ncbi:MAG: hypothetical protein Q8L85_08905 [Alphaproteobacteria bacterium]|nr:hypothetical protein [Alphaproteobacteria bacterium]